MRVCSVVIAVSITAQVLGYPTNLVKRISISTLGDVAGSEVTSGGKEVGGTSLDALTTAQTEGVASVGTSSSKGSTGIQTISNEDPGESKKNIGSQGSAQAIASAQALRDDFENSLNKGKVSALGSSSEKKTKGSLAEGKKSPSATEAESQSIQEVNIGGKKGVLVGGGQEVNALASSLGVNFESSEDESEVGKNGKNSGEAKAKTEVELEAAEVEAEAVEMEAEAVEMEAEADENRKKSSKAEAKEKESTVQAENANVGLVIDGKEIPIDPGAVDSLSDIGEEINGSTGKSDKNSAALQIEQKSSNLEAEDEKVSASETKEKESKSGEISTGNKFGVNINGKEYSLGGNLGFNFKKKDT